MTRYEQGTIVSFKAHLSTTGRVLSVGGPKTVIAYVINSSGTDFGICYQLADYETGNKINIPVFHSDLTPRADLV